MKVIGQNYRVQSMRRACYLWSTLCIYPLVLLIGLSVVTDHQAWSKPKALSEISTQELDDFRQRLTSASERIIESPTPPPHYLRRRWEWMRAQGKLPKYRDADEDVKRLLEDPEKAEMLRQLQRELWSMLGQGGESPLYESPQERDQRSAQMDLETRGTPTLPGYTHEFIPAVYPHKRMTSWNHVKDNGSLQVKIGGLTEIEPLKQSNISQCVSGSMSKYPSVYTPLTLGRDVWIDVKQFDLSCFRRQCARSGSECFLGVFSLKDWVDFKRPRGVASVSPEQSLITLSGEGDLVLSQDDAGNFYLSTTQGNALRLLKEIVLPISAPSAYFSGSWSSSSEISSLSPHPDLQLPIGLRREALSLAAKLGFDANHSYEELLFKLADWFRAFSPGTPPQLQGSVYHQLTLSQVGVCRHRSYAFLVTARALGIPTRYVTNQVHAFVEVLDPLNRWRRVDLGGEGVAPESDELTQDFASALNTPHLSFKPDDGLPRPKPYLDAIQRANQTQADLSSQRSSTLSPERSGLAETTSIQSGPNQDAALTASTKLNDQGDAAQKTQRPQDNSSPHRAVSASGQSITPSMNQLDGRSPNDDLRPSGETSTDVSSSSDLSERSNKAILTESDASKTRDLQPTSREINPTSLTRDQGDDQDRSEISEGTVVSGEEMSEEMSEGRGQPKSRDSAHKTGPSSDSADSSLTQQKSDLGGVGLDDHRRSRCSDQPQVSALSTDHKRSIDTKRALQLLHQLIEDRARRSSGNLSRLTDLKPRDGAPTIKVKLHKGKKLNRCSWVTLSGQVKRRRSPRYPPRGSKVIAALQSISGGYILHGWGTVSRRGRFRFKAQAPLDMNVGSYQLFVYFPQQRGWQASWSAVK